MKQVLYTLRENRPVTGDVWRMVLLGDTSAITAPGQFLNLALPGFTLRRPISVCHWDQETVTLLYKVVGRGTEAMRALEAGDKVDALTGLGNGFDTAKSGQRPLLVGGGGIRRPGGQGVYRHRGRHRRGEGLCHPGDAPPFLHLPVRLRPPAYAAGGGRGGAERRPAEL